MLQLFLLIQANTTILLFYQLSMQLKTRVCNIVLHKSTVSSYFGESFQFSQLSFMGQRIDS